MGRLRSRNQLSKNSVKSASVTLFSRSTASRSQCMASSVYNAIQVRCRRLSPEDNTENGAAITRQGEVKVQLMPLATQLIQRPDFIIILLLLTFPKRFFSAFQERPVMSQAVPAGQVLEQIGFRHVVL